MNVDDSATFDEPITLTFTYDPDEIPAGLTAEDLVVAWYSDAAGLERKLEHK